MAFDDTRQGSGRHRDRFEQLMDSVNFPQDLRALARAIHHQESRGGRMNTRSPNYAGAIGPMQVTKPTFEGLKREGWIPSDYDFNNPDQTTIAGLANIVALDRHFGGNPRHVAAAYYAGPKAIKTSGEIRLLRDRRNPRAPNAQEYADEIVGTIATDESGFSQFIAGKAASPSKAKQEANLNNLMEQLADLESPTTPPPEAAQEAFPAATTEIAAPQVTIPEPPDVEKRTLGEKLGRIGVEIAGGAMGTALGSRMGPIGGIVGGAAGVTAGSKFASKTFDPLPPDQERKEALISGGLTLLTGGVGRAARLFIKPKGMVEGGKELTEILSKKGIVPVPSQVFEGQGLRALENVGAASLVGAGSYRRARDAAVMGVRETAEQWRARWETALPQGKKMLQQVAEGAEQKGVQVQMGEVRMVADTMKKTFTNVDSAARKLADDLLELTNRNKTLPFAVDMDTAVARNAAAMAQQQASGVAAMPQLVGAQQIRTNIMEVIRTSSNRNEIAAARKMRDILDKSISTALAKADPALHAKWRIGNDFYRASKQGEEISDIFSKALVSGGQPGDIGGKALLNQIKEHKLKTLGTELTEKQIKNINEFGKALMAAEGKGEHAFEFVARGMQINAVIRTAQGLGAAAALGADQAGAPRGVQEAALIVALGPVALAKIFASPTAFRMLMATMKAPAGSSIAVQAATRFATQLAQEGIITTPEMQTYEGIPVTIGPNLDAGLPTPRSHPLPG